MTKKVYNSEIDNLIEMFRQSAIDYYVACDNEEFKKQKVEVNRGKNIAERLDSFGENGRLALAPLLDDPDQGVRVVAAFFLLKTNPERAIAALEDVRKSPTFFQRIDAGNFLEGYAQGKLGR